MSISTVLYKNKKLSNQKYAVRLRLYFGREHFISLGDSALPTEWNEKTGRFNSRAENFEPRNVYLSKKEREAWTIINALPVYSLEEFKKKFKGSQTQLSVQEFIVELVGEMRQKGKVGNSYSYNNLLNVLKLYKQNPIDFLDVNYNFLTKFEMFILQRGCKQSTTHCYMRTLRAVMNESIRRGMMEKESYPFATQFNKSGYSFSHLRGGYNPKPLSLDELERIKHFDVSLYPHLKPAYDLFMFLIRARGINFVDACELTHDSIQDNRLRYIRQKTGTSYSIKLTPEVTEIIDRYKGEKYLFPILDDAPTNEIKKYNFIRRKLRLFNENLDEIAQLCNIKKITSYTARYSYTNVLVKKNVAPLKIQQALGHSSFTTTQHYIQLFSDSEVDTIDHLI